MTPAWTVTCADSGEILADRVPARDGREARVAVGMALARDPGRLVAVPLGEEVPPSRARAVGDHLAGARIARPGRPVPRRRLADLPDLTPPAEQRDGGIGPAVRRAPRWFVDEEGRVDAASVASSPLAVALALLGVDLGPVLAGTLHPRAAREIVLGRWPGADPLLRAMVVGVLRGKLRG